MCDCAARLDDIEQRLAKLEGRKPVQSGEFEQFWGCFPKKVGKLAAQKAFKNAQNRPRIDDLLAAIERAKRSEQWRSEGGKFIPNPATWLNQGRWDDEPVQVVVVQPKAQVKVERTPIERHEYSPPPPEVMAVLNRIGKGMA